MKNQTTLGILGCLLFLQAEALENIGIKWDFDVWTSASQNWDYGPTSIPNSPFLGSGLIKGSGITYTSGGGSIVGPSGSVSDRAPQARGWTFNSAPDATDCLKVEFTAVESNTTLPVLGISFWEKVNAGSVGGPTKCALHYSTNRSVWIPIFIDSATTTTWKKFYAPLNLSVSFNQVLWFRISGYGATLPTGTLAIDSLKIMTHMPSPLPVELLYFTARAEEESVKLEWVTASEESNDHFTLERSDDAYVWQKIADIHAVGNSQAESHYEFKDEHCKDGLNFYRLKQFDIDGLSKNLGERMVMIHKPPKTYQVFLGEIFSVQGLSFDVFDINGRLVKSCLLVYRPNCRGIEVLNFSNGTSSRLLVM